MDEKELFEKVIRMWAGRRDPNEQFTLNQLAGLIFHKGNPKNASLIGKTLDTFHDCFVAPQYGGYKWRVKWMSVRRDHLALYHELFPHATIEDSKLESKDPLSEMKLALDDEIKAIREEIRTNPIEAFEVSKPVELGDGSFLYDAKIALSTDAEFPIPEGVRVRLIWPKPIFPSVVEGALLSYDPLKSTMFFELEQPLTELQRESRFRVQPCIEELIRAVQEQLGRVGPSDKKPIWKLVLENFDPARNEWNAPIQLPNLDQSQRRAAEICLNSDITLLWGPPGTGKTHTLGRIITSAALAGKKVLAASIANVAVDQMASHAVRALLQTGLQGESLLDDGRILRFGHARLPEVTSERRLFPNKEKAQAIRRGLHDLRQNHRKEQNAEKRALMQSGINELTTQLRNITKESIVHARVVLTTAVQTCIEPAITETRFDLAIVDEASMMSLPYLTCVGMHANERIVIAGDFQQLGPIARSQTERAYRWLHKDPFEHVGIGGDTLVHEGLTMLTFQRRMKEEICDLINKRFYRGDLRTIVEPPRTNAVFLPPSPGEAAVLVSITPQDGSFVEQTKEGSRRNVKSAQAVARLARYYVEHDPKISVGIISPYSAQVSMIKRLLKEPPLDESAGERLRVGTVHAFQGSESDLIIWDLVESRNHRIGKLYHRSTGNRMANVAISRAKDKLVIVGDREAFFEAPGHNLVDELKKILKFDFDYLTENMVDFHDIHQWLA